MLQGLKVQIYKRYLILGIIILILVAALGIWIAPRLLGLYYQVKGGTLLEQAVVDAGVDLSSAIPCSVQPLPESSSTRVDQAIQQLQTALAYTPRLAQASLLMGHAECLLGEPISAIEAYQNFIRLRPKNPLGYLELGFAYADECEKDISGIQDSGLCSLSNLRQSIIEAWHVAGVEPGSFIEAGNLTFSSRQYAQAERWYTYAALTDSIPNPVKFRWSVAEIMLGHDLTRIPDPQVLPVHDLSDYLEIKGSALQWMLDDMLGQTIGNSTSGDPNVGYLSFSGEAIAVINVHQTSTYHFIIKAQNTPPPPIKLQLEIDFRPVVSFELWRGDGSWDELGTEITLDAGLHILGINFLNDAIIDGIDRNAIIERVIIQR